MWDIAFFDLETEMLPDKELAELGPQGIKEIKVFWATGRCGTFTTHYVAGTDIYSPRPAAVDILTHTSGTVRSFLDQANAEGATLVGHNIIRFDIPIIKNLLGIDIYKEYPNITIRDTLIYSRLVHPSRVQHSLESWAGAFCKTKLDFDNLVERCKSDVLITEDLWYHLQNYPDRLKNPIELEHEVARVVAQQVQDGVAFNRHGALGLLHDLNGDIGSIRDEVIALKILTHIPESQWKWPPKMQFKKDGTLSSHMERYLDEHGAKWNPETRHVEVPTLGAEKLMDWYPVPLLAPLVTRKVFDLSSTDEIKRVLIYAGWKPTLWNYKKDKSGRVSHPLEKTSCKLYDENKKLCPNLLILAETLPWVSKIVEYLSLKNRRSVLCSDDHKNGWINNMRVNSEDLINSDADSVGTRTYRFKHKVVANVPRVTSRYGKEMRGLFVPRADNRVFVGWDAKALEARIEAHYTYPYDGGAYAKELLEGDIHTKNQMNLGLPTRDKAKTFKYAVTYGARPAKLARTFDWDTKEAEVKYDAFWGTNKALADLKDTVEKAWEARGHLVAIDGHTLMVEHKHTCLNTVFQSAGAILMKYAMVIADKMIHAEGLDAIGVIRYHDEEQWDVLNIHAERVAEIGRKSIILAGKYLKLKVPMDADVKIGRSWAETH